MYQESVSTLGDPWLFVMTHSLGMNVGMTTTRAQSYSKWRIMIISWLKKITWVIGVLRRTLWQPVRKPSWVKWTLDSEDDLRTWLWRWLPHRLSNVSHRTTVLLRTRITQIIFFNQGILLGSNHFLNNNTWNNQRLGSAGLNTFVSRDFQ